MNAHTWEDGLYIETGPYFLLYVCDISCCSSVLVTWHGVIICVILLTIYRQIFSTSRTLVGNWIVDRSDVVGASPVGTVQLHLHSRLNTWIQWIGQKQLQDVTISI